METGQTNDFCVFNRLLTKSVPHILEMIFLSLDYETFKNCMKVNRVWHQLLKSNSYQLKGKLLFHGEITEDERKLWHAARNGYVEEVKTLLSSGMFDINYSNSLESGFGETALHVAAGNGHKDMVQFLLDSGAELDIQDTYGSTPLSLALAASNVPNDVVKLLLDKGAELETENDFGSTPLLYAVGWGNTGIVQMLLHRGAEINKKNRKGDTPLHLAARLGQEDAVGLLLERGAELNLLDGEGRTPIKLAEARGHMNVVKLLMRSDQN